VTADGVTSIVLDHLSWISFQVRPVSLGRIIARSLMLIGVLLIASFYNAACRVYVGGILA
jgi:uncharacterized membrane protein YdcZ (DUF606 family)